MNARSLQVITAEGGNFKHEVTYRNLNVMYLQNYVSFLIPEVLQLG